MRTLLLALVTSAAAWVAASAPGQAQETTPPTPPQQSQPWTPPATNGDDQPLPSGFILPSAEAKTLPANLSLMASWSPKVPPAILRFDGPKFDYGKFENLLFRPGVTIAKATGPNAVLTPTQTQTILSGDLRDYFDFSRPGTYHVKAVFHLPGQPDANSPEITFSVAPPKP